MTADDKPIRLSSFKTLINPDIRQTHQGVCFTHFELANTKVKCYEALGVGIYLRCQTEDILHDSIWKQAKIDNVSPEEFMMGVRYNFSFIGTLRWRNVKEIWASQTQEFQYLDPQPTAIVEAKIDVITSLRLKKSWW